MRAKTRPFSKYQAFAWSCCWPDSAASEKLSTPSHPEGSTSFLKKSALPSENLFGESEILACLGRFQRSGASSIAILQGIFCTSRHADRLFAWDGRAIGRYFALAWVPGLAGVDSPDGAGSSSVGFGMSGGLMLAISGGGGGSKPSL
jgi:hypothetical protein